MSTNHKSRLRSPTVLDKRVRDEQHRDVGRCGLKLMFETDGLKGTCFQGVETTSAFNTRGRADVNLVVDVCKQRLERDVLSRS